MQWGNQARMPQGRPAQPKKKKKKKTVKLERGKDYFTEIHLYLFITVNLTEE